MVIRMNNSEYWKQRFALQENALNNMSIKHINVLKEEYDKALIKIQKDITDWYTRLAENNEITYAGSKQILNKKELKEFRWTVEEYIKRGKENAINEKWIKELENASAKVHIEKLEAIQKQVQNELEYLYNKYNAQTIEIEKQQYSESYYRTTYEIQRGLNNFGNIRKLDTSKIEKIVSKPWTTDNRTFSDRIWSNKNELLNTLQRELVQATTRGDKLDDVIRSISERFDVSKRKAGRLVMTESAFFSSVGQKDCFNDLGVKQYEIVATLDTHTSEICQELDGKVFNIKDYQVGITAPPFHINCRSCTAPYFEDDNEGSRIARGEDGKTYYVPSTMKYKEWYDKYIDKEEGIINNFLNKNTKLKDITNQKENLIKGTFKNDNIKNIALNTNIKSIKTGGNKAFHRRGNIVLKENYDSHTVRHEIAHSIDYNNKWLSSNKNFMEAIQKDKKIILSNKDLYKNIIKNNSNFVELSDIMSGITNNKIKGRYKHNNKYWEKPHKLEREIFAQMFTTAGNNDLKQLEIFQKYLPNIFKEFDELIRRIL